MDGCLHVLLVRVWISSSFDLQSKGMYVMRIAYFKLPIGVIVSMCGCLSLYVNPVMNFWLVQVCTLPLARWQFHTSDPGRQFEQTGANCYFVVTLQTDIHDT